MWERRICPIRNCNGEIKRDITYNTVKGEFCPRCIEKIFSLRYQVMVCEICGTPHYLRKLINPKEEVIIELGVCEWCEERLKEEDELVKAGVIKDNQRTMNNFNRKILDIMYRIKDDNIKNNDNRTSEEE